MDKSRIRPQLKSFRLAFHGSVINLTAIPVMKRRRFLHTLAKTSLAFSTINAWSAERSRGANERVNVGLIGCGGRGNLVGKLMKAVPGVEFVALCDVYDAQFAAAREWAGERCKTVKDFRRVLEMKDVDAVLIATPDHWHGIP